MGEATGPRRDRGVSDHVPALLFSLGDDSQRGVEQARLESAIDLTDEIAPSDYPVLVFLREQLVKLRSQNRELTEKIEQGRYRLSPLELALAHERRRAANAESEITRLQRRVQNLEKKLTKLRSAGQPIGNQKQVGLLRRALSRALKIRSFTESADPKTAARIETFGKLAHLHKEAMERNNGKMTLGESLEIRRQFYGDKIQASSLLFGKQKSSSILYRDVPEGKRAQPKDRIALTEEGERLAAAYRRVSRSR